MRSRVVIWLIISLMIGGIVSLFASSHPDGYEKAGEELGFIGKATSYFSAPLPDYAFQGSDSWISSSLAGMLGVGITFAVFYVIGKLVGKKSS